jgi:diguanylate cyclase (GGDEF)-like protein/PAS domain S-box-containing protein
MNLSSFDGLQTPIWIFDIQRLRMVWANQAALWVWAAPTLDGLMNRDFSQVSASTQARLLSYLEMFRRGQTVQEAWTFYPQGKPVSVQCLCSGVELDDGRLAMLVEGHLPQQSQIEQDTLRSVEAFRHSSCLVSVYTETGALLLQNPAAVTCYGNAPSFEQRFLDPSLAQQAIAALKQGQVWLQECQVCTLTGTPWHRLELRPTRDPVTGQATMVLCETDISDRKHSEIRRQQLEQERQLIEQALEESDIRYQSIVQVLAEGVVIHQADGAIIACNTSAQEILGLSADQLMGRTSVDPHWHTVHEDGTPFPGEDHPAMVTLRTGEPQRNVVMGVYRPDHSLRWISINTQPIVDPGTAIPSTIVVSFADITERKINEDLIRTSEARWQFALEGSGDGVWDWNAQTNTVFFSNQWKAMLGYRPDEIGDTLDEWDSRVHPDDKAQCYKALECHFRGETPLYQNEHRVRCKDGNYKWILDRGKVIQWDGNGRPLRVIGTHTDMTERHQMEQTLRQQAEMLQAIFDHIPIMMVLMTPKGDVQFINRATENILGWSLEEWQQLDILARCYPDPHYRQRVIDHIQTPNHQWQDFKTHNALEQMIDTSWYNIRLSDGRIIGIGQDITDRKQWEERLQHLATHDKLTSLPNRYQFDEYLAQEWKRLAREQQPLSLILCDIDEFKAYNDALGHLAGDYCLTQVAQTIASVLKRPADLATRYGGEEFALILPNTPLGGAVSLTEDIRQALAQLSLEHPDSEVSHHVTLSFGVACVYPSTQLVPQHLTAMADGALYDAKKHGRNRYCIAK